MVNLAWGYARTSNVDRLVNEICARNGIAYAPWYMDTVKHRGKRKTVKVYPFKELVFFTQALKRKSYEKFVTDWHYDCIFQHEIDLIKDLNDSGAYNEAAKKVRAMMSMVGTKQVIDSPIHPFQGQEIDVVDVIPDQQVIVGEINFMGKMQKININL